MRTDRKGVRGRGTAIVIEKSLDYVLVPVKESVNLSLLEAPAVMLNLSGGAKLI